MKKLLLLAIIVMTAGTMTARHLTPAEALQRAESAAGMKAMSKSPVKPECVMQIKARNSTDASVYVFRDGNAGYRILSADDVAAPVLGYSDSGTFNPESLPDNMRWWLDEYARQIEWASSNGGTAYKAPLRVEQRAIAPLLSTTWNQDAPYNNLCPKMGTQATYTGCVATAMAQVMKYHNWPEKGNSSNSYSWNNQTLSMDFATTTFDWNNMLDNYDGESTTAQQNAVATLMKACGYSVNMDYGTQESGASSLQVGYALREYFNYDPALTNADRDLYTTTQWEEMIYNNLADCGPVFYSGLNSSSGHAFVCDGYASEGYFHFNWGWDGMSDGYFMLSALNPGAQGIGGSTSGYNSGQEVVLGIRKPQSGSSLSVPMFVAGGIPSAAVSGDAVYFFGPFYNYSTYAVNGRFAIGVTQQGTTEGNIVAGSDATEYAVGSGIQNLGMNTSDLADGTYQCAILFVTSDNEIYQVMFPAYAENYFELTKSASGVTVTLPQKGELTASEVTFKSAFYIGSRFNVTATIHNTGNADFNRTIYPVLLKSESMDDMVALGEELTADFAAASSTPVDYVGSWITSSDSPLTAGNYYFTFAVNNGYRIVGNSLEPSYKAISAFYPITLNAAAEDSDIAVTLKVNGDASTVTAEQLSFDITVNCTSGYFADPLTIAIFPISGGSAIGQYTSECFFVEAGKSQTMTVSAPFTQGQPETRYMAAAYHGSSQMTDPVTFTIAGTSTIIDEVSNATWTFMATGSKVTITAPEPIRAVSLYSSTGAGCLTGDGNGDNTMELYIDPLAPGIYVASVTTDSGIRSFKFMKN